MEEIHNQEQEERKLYERARKRIHFKIHMSIYILTNVFFWLLWGLLFRNSQETIFLKLVLSITLFWAIFIIAHYLIVYKWNKSYIEKELTVLRKKQQKQEKELAKLKNNNQ
jgi:hypothetical protein